MGEEQKKVSFDLNKLRAALYDKIDLTSVFMSGSASHVHKIQLGSSKLEITIHTTRGERKPYVTTKDVVSDIRRDGTLMPSDEVSSFLDKIPSEMSMMIIQVYMVLSDIILEKIASASQDFTQSP